MLEVEAGSRTDRGPRRETNEDSAGAFPPANPLQLERKGYLYLVADGMGGHQAGEVASSTAVAAAGDEYYSPANSSRIEAALRNAVQTANLRVHDRAQRDVAYRGMGTTLSAVALAGAQAYVAHVGDSRVYHWRDGLLRQLTADHSEAAELVRLRVLSPSKVGDHPSRNVLTRTIGQRLIVRPDFLRQPVLPGDQLLLCTDGLWSELADAELSSVLSRFDPAEAAATLVEMALARDCADNVTAQVVRVRAVGDAAEPPRRSVWLSSIFQRNGRGVS